MARKGQRIKIEKNIYRDAGGYDITMVVRGESDSQRFKGHDWTLAQLRAERSAMHTRLNGQADKRAAGHGIPGTMLGDAKTFLKIIGHKASTTTQIMHWVRALGPQTKRSTITAARIQQQITTWEQQAQAHTLVDQATGTRKPYSRESVRKQLRTLRQMFRTLDGKSAANPAMDVDMPAPPKPEVRAMDLDVAESILAAMPRSITRARLALILFLGITQVEIMRLRESHVDWKAGTITILGRKKGDGSNPRVLPFAAIAAARAAVLEFASYGQWAKRFDTGSMQASFTLAAGKVKAPEGVRPYDLRHTCGTELYKRTRDIHVVQRWLGHRKVETTMRYILGATDDSLLAAALAMNAFHVSRGKSTGTGETHVH